MHSAVILDGKSLTIEDVWYVAQNKKKVAVPSENLTLIDKIRYYIEKIAEKDNPHYGINTGFGALSEKKIAKKDLEKLQHLLILSHAVGVGEPLSFAEARSLMLLRANTIARGNSGCRKDILLHLIALLNSGCAPYVPSKGSVGASGDLAPLAHLALLLIGKGQAYIDGKKVTAQKALRHAKLKPIKLKAKEGLALINGTQAMAGLGCLLLVHAEQLSDLADVIGACSVEALKGSDTPFDSRIHQTRPHNGQEQSAHHLRLMLKKSEIRKSHSCCSKVQDAYSLRCMPQVHGASRDTFAFVRNVLEKEINSATDNPLIFLRFDQKGIDILSGGNFHGQPLAFALDYLAIATSELGNISERRMEQMLNPALSAGLPPFLAVDPGINSGFMILQVTAAALVNENKIYCHPASTDSISTSASREDHVSMGMTSANKAKVIIENCYTILGIELIIAGQGVDMRKPLLPGIGVQAVLKNLRKVVAFTKQDRIFYDDIKKACQLCKSGILNQMLSTLSGK
jgi:histidine ammonia-lyase